MSKRPNCAGLGGPKNGDLLNAAKSAGFEVSLTVDRGFEYEQNLAGRRIAVVILRTKSIPPNLARLQRSRQMRPSALAVRHLS